MILKQFLLLLSGLIILVVCENDINDNESSELNEGMSKVENTISNLEHKMEEMSGNITELSNLIKWVALQMHISLILQL